MLPEVLTNFVGRCHDGGLDLAAPLQVGWYNSSVDPPLRLPDFGNPESLAVVVGNSRALWPPFLAALRAAPALLRDPNPVEAYTMHIVQDALSVLNVPYEIRWAHMVNPRPIAIQRIAHIAGLAYLAPSNLSVHATYGPWIALRAVAVVNATATINPPANLTGPCSDCESACLPAFRRALANPGEWRRWLEIRDSCPTGRLYRYDESQIVYHYTKDHDALTHAVASLR